MTKGRFREFWQCDFDICGDYKNCVADAEIIKIIDDILIKLDVGK